MGAALVGAMLTGLYRATEPVDFDPTPKKPRASEDVTASQDKKAPAPNELPGRTTHTEAAVRDVSPLVSIETYASERSVPSVLQAAIDPKRWMKEAREGNGRAGVALYRLGIASQNKMSDLSDVPKDVTNEPLKWLELAATQGDLEAKVLYALNANPNLLTNGKSGAPPEAIRQVQEKSLAFLREAAEAGIEDAFNTLATGYRSGMFGDPDPTASVTYLLALAELSPTPDRRARAEAQSARLKTFDRNQAVEAAKQIVARFR